VPHLKGDRCGAAAYSARVRALGGVTAADLAPLTGSLVVRHDGLPETRERILRNLEEFGRATIPRPTEAPPSAATAAAPARLDDVVAGALAGRITERLVRMAVAAVI
jgi:hypothetical protein